MSQRKNIGNSGTSKEILTLKSKGLSQDRKKPMFYILNAFSMSFKCLIFLASQSFQTFM